MRALSGLLLLCVALEVIAERDPVEGFWFTGNGVIAIRAGQDTLRGRIVSINDPVYSPQEDPTRAGQQRRDDNNPDTTLRQRPIVGLELFENYGYEDGIWAGEIYDPESGNTYKSRMKRVGDNLEIRGYIGLPMFGRTSVFTPIPCQPELASLPQIEDLGLCAD